MLRLKRRNIQSWSATGNLRLTCLILYGACWTRRIEPRRKMIRWFMPLMLLVFIGAR